MIYSIRGAASVSDDDPKSIGESAVALYSEMIRKNDVMECDIVNLIISHTKDLRSFNSATALRRAGLCKEVPLFCVQEADIEGSMTHVIRMMLTVQSHEMHRANHVYLGEAAKLRPDLSCKNQKE